MEPEKFEKEVKKVLEAREIKPSAAGWEKLEQRLQKGQKKRPYLLWMSSAAAIAAIFFVLGSYFNPPVASEGPQLVEEPTPEPVLEEKAREPEVIQMLASEEQERAKEEKKPSAERGVKNAIFEPPVSGTSSEETALAEETSSEEILIEEKITSDVKSEINNSREEIAEADLPLNRSGRSIKVSDHEVEALLLLATAELKADSIYTVNSHDLLHQVEYELDQSFRQKVFEVVKEGFKKAKTAVATREINFN